MINRMEVKVNFNKMDTSIFDYTCRVRFILNVINIVLPVYVFEIQDSFCF